MDFPLNSSLILAATVGLWLLWVGPYVFRRSGLSTVPVAGAPSPSSTVIRSSISADGLSQQGNIMYNASTSRPNDITAPARLSGPRSGFGTPTPLPSPRSEFRIHYGRAALALMGALALACTVVGLPLALFGAVSWWLPGAAVATTAAATVSLRTLAVRDRRRRVDAAFRVAMASGRPAVARQDAASSQDVAPSQEAALPRDVSLRQDVSQPPIIEEPVRQHRETVLFDAQSTAGSIPSASNPVTESTSAASSVTTAPGAADRRLTAAELRTAALEVAAKAAPVAPSGPPKTSTTPWEPVAVPKPTYVQAPVAQRPAPEPLVLPEPPKPAARTSLRPPATDSTDAAAPSTGKINLDDVLQRRRA